MILGGSMNAATMAMANGAGSSPDRSGGSLIHLDEARFELLFEACRLHTDGYTTGDPTLLAC